MAPKASRIPLPHSRMCRQASLRALPPSAVLPSSASAWMCSRRESRSVETCKGARPSRNNRSRHGFAVPPRDDLRAVPGLALRALAPVGDSSRQDEVAAGDDSEEGRDLRPSAIRSGVTWIPVACRSSADGDKPSCLRLRRAIQVRLRPRQVTQPEQELFETPSCAAIWSQVAPDRRSSTSRARTSSLALGRRSETGTAVS